MQPIHSVEYEVTSEMVGEIQRTLVRWELRRGWRRDVPFFLGGLVFATLIIWLGLAGWIAPAVAGGLMCVVMLFVIGAVLRRWSAARGAAMTTLLALHASDRRIHIDFGEERVRLETEFFRGEGAWTELDEVVVFPAFWVLYLSNGGQILIPSQLVSPELEAFIRAKAEQLMAPI